MPSLRVLSVMSLVVMGLLVLPLAALADDGEEHHKADAPKVKVKVRRIETKQLDQPAAVRDPMQSIHRWLMREMPKLHQQDGDAPSPLHAWFDGGTDVPLAGLRDVLKEDGWTADKLVAWIHQHSAQAMHGTRGRGPHVFGHGGSQMGPRGMIPQRRGMQRGFRMRGPRGFMRRRGMFGGRSPWSRPWQRGGHGDSSRAPFPWGNPWYGMGQGGGYGMPPMGGGMFGGPGHQQGRTIIMWNDGSGWQRRELPGHGPWMGPQGPGAGAHPQPPQRQQPPNMESLHEWLKSLNPQGSGQAMPGGDLPIPKEWMQYFRRMRQGAHGTPSPSPWGRSYRYDHPGGSPPQHAQPKVRVKNLKVKQPGEAVIIEEEVEVEGKK